MRPQNYGAYGDMRGQGDHRNVQRTVSAGGAMEFGISPRKTVDSHDLMMADRRMSSLLVRE